MEKIINGVDISKCNAKPIKLKDGLYCFIEHGKCIDNPDCYYKQLRQKEEECEEWKRVANQYKLEKVKAQNRYQQIAGSYNRAESYKQALDEIEKYTMKVFCIDCVNALCEGCPNSHILQIIQKVKGE